MPLEWRLPVANFRNDSGAFTTEAATILVNPQVLPTEEEPYYHRNIRVEATAPGCVIERHTERKDSLSMN